MKRGFTLIELLVVISIIGVLSSVVLTSLNSARNKAKDSAIKLEVNQLVTLLSLNYDVQNSYQNLNQYGWMEETMTCEDSFLGTYAVQARSICRSIYNKASTYDPGYRIYIGPTDAAYSSGIYNTYTIMVALNNGRWYCAGSSGRKGEYLTYDGFPGCWNNP